MKAIIEIPDIPSVIRNLRFRPPLTDDELEDLCRRNDDYRIERTREGVIQVVSPTSLDTGGGNAEIITQLRNWVATHGSGHAYDSSAGFYLSDGSMLSPDASYLKAETRAKITKLGRKRIPHICPDFIIELISESDTLASSKKKMSRWMENGVLLGWLVEPKKRRVWVYSSDASEPTVASGNLLSGSGPVEGFRLNLDKVWNEYR